MRLDTGLHPGPGSPLSPLEDGGGWSAPEAGVRARLGAGSRSGVYHQSITVASTLGAPVPPVLGVGSQPAVSDVTKLFESLNWRNGIDKQSNEKWKRKQ